MAAEEHASAAPVERTMCYRAPRARKSWCSICTARDAAKPLGACGIFPHDGYIDRRGRTPAQIAEFIAERVHIQNARQGT